MICAVLASMLFPGAPAHAQATTDIVLYDDAFGPGVVNRSSAGVNPSNTSRVRSGEAAIAVKFRPRSGLHLAVAEGVEVAPTDVLTLSVNGGGGKAAWLHLRSKYLWPTLGRPRRSSPYASSTDATVACVACFSTKFESPVEQVQRSPKTSAPMVRSIGLSPLCTTETTLLSKPLDGSAITRQRAKTTIVRSRKRSV